MRISKEVIIYAAGFFDGEGTVSTNLRGRSIQIQVGQNVRKPLDYMQKFFGGKVFWNSNRYNGTHIWSMSGVDARNFLRDIYPYCLVKEGDIKAAFEYTDHDLEKRE